MKYLPDYALINREEVIKLQDCSARTMSIYIAIIAYACKDKYAFPSHATINEYLGMEMPQSTISRCLNKLQEIGLIKVGKQRSKQRYELVFRRAVQVAKGIVSAGKAAYEKSKAALGELSKTEKPSLAKRKTDSKRETQHSFKKNKRKSFISFLGFGETQTEIAKRKSNSPAETVFSKLMVLSPTLDPAVLPKSEKLLLFEGFMGKTNEPEWLEWVMETHSSNIPKLLEALAPGRSAEILEKLE